MHIFSISRPSVLLLIYGLFAVLCHVSAILLFATTLDSHDVLTFTYRIFPLLEHSLMSTAVLFVGALGLEYIRKHMQGDNE